MCQNSEKPQFVRAEGGATSSSNIEEKRFWANLRNSYYTLRVALRELLQRHEVASNPAWSDHDIVSAIADTIRKFQVLAVVQEAKQKQAATEKAKPAEDLWRFVGPNPDLTFQLHGINVGIAHSQARLDRLGVTLGEHGERLDDAMGRIERLEADADSLRNKVSSFAFQVDRLEAMETLRKSQVSQSLLEGKETVNRHDQQLFRLSCEITTLLATVDTLPSRIERLEAQVFSGLPQTIDCRQEGEERAHGVPAPEAG